MGTPSFSKTIKYTALKDNNRAIELVKAPKTRPLTKNVTIKCHKFRSCTQKVDVIIKKVDTAEQETDFLTKLLVLQLFCYLRKKVMGW